MADVLLLLIPLVFFKLITYLNCLYFSAGYSEDSDYTSDVNFPVNGQFPNAATSQYLQVSW